MSQTPYFTVTGGVWPHADDADDALMSYLQNTAPNNLAAYLTAAVASWAATPFEDPGTTAEQNFPRVHVWTERGESTYPKAATMHTRILVWEVDASPVTAAQTAQNIAGAIASGIQQSRDTSGDDWTYYINHNQPVVVQPDLAFIDFGELLGLAQARLDITWTHKE